MIIRQKHTAASKQLCKGITLLEKVHRSGRKLASQNIDVGRRFKLLHDTITPTDESFLYQAKTCCLLTMQSLLKFKLNTGEKCPKLLEQGSMPSLVYQVQYIRIFTKRQNLKSSFEMDS